MRKVKWVLLMALMIFGLTACGGSDAGSKAASGSAGKVSANGYSYTSNSVKIAMNAEAKDIIDGLGEPDKYFESESCAFKGLDKVYTYKGFKINTYPVDDKDYILSVVFMDDTVETDEGVFIGSEKDSVTGAYGEPTSSTDTSMIYEKDGTKMTFVLNDDKVTSIEIAAITEK